MWRNSGTFVVALLMSASAFAANPDSFTYQGQLLDGSGNPSSDTVAIKFQVYNPAADCLLYEEEQTGLNFLTSGGHFSLQVGSPLANAKRTANDPALAMSAIFSNAAVQIRAPGTNCGSGYTPTAGDLRKLRVTITGPGGADVLSPDQVISSAPFAMSAQTLQGKQPGDFIANTIDGMQAALEALVNGTSSLYLKNDGSNASPVNINNQIVTGVAAPVGATDATNKSYVDTKLAGQAISATAPADGQVLVWNTASSQWQAASPTDASVQAHARATAPACSGGQASMWDGAAWNCVAAGGGGGGAIDYPGPSGSVTLTNASAKIHSINFPEGGIIQLPDATTMPLGGPLFTFLNPGSESLPIVNAAGQFLGAMAGGSTPLQMYLFNNSTSGGDWRPSGSLSGSGLEKAVISTFNATGSFYQNFFVSLSGATYLAFINDNGTYKVMALSIDTVNKTATFGSPVALPDQSYGEGIIPLSATAAVVVQSSGALTVVNVSGTTVTPGAADNAAGCGGSNTSRFAKVSATQILCVGNNLSVGKRIDVSGTTFTPASFTAGGGTGSVSGLAVISPSLAIVFLNSTNTYAYPVNITGLTFGAQTDLGNIGGASIQSDANRSAVYSPDGTNVVVAIQDYNSYTQIIKKLTVSASTVTIQSTQTLSNGSGSSPTVYFDGTNVWAQFTKGASQAHRALLSGLTGATPTIGAASKGTECYGPRISNSRCLELTNISQAPNDSELVVRFLLGF